MNYIFTSDQHFAHRNTPTRHIANNFNKLVLGDTLKGMDILFLGGDWYDRHIGVDTDENLQTISLNGHLLDRCQKENVMVRMIEGTPGHDRAQPKTFENLNNLRAEKCDFKYIDILDIEYIEKFNIYVLYIPDEWCNNHDDLERQIENKLREHNITQVDIAIMHGVFAYQMAGIPYKGFSFKEEYFLNLVKGFIHIGHFHIYSDFDRIIASGSFDRLKHGEEGDKGFLIVKDGTPTFIKNENAYIYKTLRLNKNETTTSLDKKIFKYPKGSFIRLEMGKDHPFNSIFRDIVIRYVDYTITRKPIDSVDKQVTNILDDSNFNLLQFDFINKDLKNTVREIILRDHVLDDRDIEILDEHLILFEGSENKEEMNNVEECPR